MTNGGSGYTSAPGVGFTGGGGGTGAAAVSQFSGVTQITDPTTGGVTASYAMLGDLNIGEPGALIGFAGPRVIAQTIRQKLGPPFCSDAERIHSHGMRGKFPKNQGSMFTPPWR